MTTNLNIKNTKAYTLDQAQNLKQAVTILHRTQRYHYHDMPKSFNIKLNLNKPIAFTAAPVTTEAPERGQYANKVTNVDPTLATEKQVRALIYAISTHDISSKELHLPKTTSLTKVAMRYMLDKANSAPKKMNSYYQFTLINNWFARQYTYYGLAIKQYNEFTKEQDRVRYNLANNPQKKLIDSINEEEAQYSKYNI